MDRPRGRYDSRTGRRWRYGTPPKGNANFIWVQHIVHHPANLPRAELRKPGVLHELSYVLQGKDLVPGRKKQLLHVLAAHTGAASGDVGSAAIAHRASCSGSPQVEAASAKAAIFPETGKARFQWRRSFQTAIRVR